MSETATLPEITSVHTIETLPFWEESYRDCCATCCNGIDEREMHNTPVDAAGRCETYYNTCPNCEREPAALLMDGARTCKRCAADTIEGEIEDAVSDEAKAALQHDLKAVQA